MLRRIRGKMKRASRYIEGKFVKRSRRIKRNVGWGVEWKRGGRIEK